MFNIFRKKKRCEPTSVQDMAPDSNVEQMAEQLAYLSRVHTITDTLTESMLQEMENYDVLFHDVWPPLRVPAKRILADLKNAGHHLPSLIRELNATYSNTDNRLPVIKLERRDGTKGSK